MGNHGSGGPPPSVSPDGRWIFRSTGNGGLNAIHLASVVPELLVKDHVVTQPFWSPDSKYIAFFEDGKLKTAPIAGGPAKTICETPPPVTTGTWNEDGVILFSSAGLIHRVLAAGGQPTAITKLDPAHELEHLTPAFLPDGRHFLYLAAGTQPADNAVYVADLDGKEQRKKLFNSDSRPMYAAPGYVVFNREGTIFAQPFNAKKLELEDEPVRLAEGVPFIGAGTVGGATTGSNVARNASYAISQSGILVYRIGNNTGGQSAAVNAVGDRTLTWFDQNGNRTGQVGGPGAYAGVDVAANGKRVAVHVHEPNGGDSWFFDSDQGRMQRLTFDAAQNNQSPIWSPDGTRFAYASKRGNKWGIYVKAADGAAKEELITESDQMKAPMSWTPDGKTIIYWITGAATVGDIWYVSVEGDKKAKPFLQTPANERWPQLSPDGKWLAYTSNETGRYEIYIKPFPEGPGKWQVSLEGGATPRWRGDSRELYFANAPNLFGVDIKVSGTSIVPGPPRSLFSIPTNPGASLVPTDYLFYAASADGKRFLIPQLGGGATPTSPGGGSLAETLITAAEQGTNATTLATTNSLMVVVNWPRLLKKK
jgi:Tol biopolymer transport system component